MADDVMMECVRLARLEQWSVDELPWDEPIDFPGNTRREQTLHRLDLIDLTYASYHLQLGGRVRLGDHLVRSWTTQPALQECLEWHDADGHRALSAFRRLGTALQVAGEPIGRERDSRSTQRLWRLGYPSFKRMQSRRVLFNILIDETLLGTMWAMIAKGSRVPIVRAVYGACADDCKRHVCYLTGLASSRVRSTPRELLVHQTMAVLHVAHAQSVLRPYLRLIDAVTGVPRNEAVIQLFAALSRVFDQFGPEWNNSWMVRSVHRADRSAWLVWLLR